MSMTIGPQGQVRPVSDYANAVRVAKILTGEVEEEYHKPESPFMNLANPITLPPLPENLPTDRQQRLIALRRYFEEIQEQVLQDGIARLTPEELEVLRKELLEQSTELGSFSPEI